MGNTLPIIDRAYKVAEWDVASAIHPAEFTPENRTTNPGAYRFLLHLASFCFKTKDFFWKDADFLVHYIADLGSIKKSEARRVAENLVLYGTTNEDEAISHLRAVLTAMRVRVDGHGPGTCLAPSVDKDLYSHVIGDGFTTSWKGCTFWKPEPLFDFSISIFRCILT